MKFTNFSASFFVNSAFIIALVGLASCRPNDDWDQNKTFSGRYSKDIEEIKASRIDPSTIKLDPNAKLEFTAPVDQNSARYTNNNVAVPEYYTTQQFSNQMVAPSGFQFPVEMFENNYNPPINSPFRKIGAEFDAIDVPRQDAYGVKAGMSEKEYLLVSRKLLQKNVDQINKQRTPDDVENSEILISEQKKLKRKEKMIKIFGQESVTVEDEAKSSAASKSGDGKNKKSKDDAGKNKVVDKDKTDAVKPVSAQAPVVAPTPPPTGPRDNPIPSAPVNPVQQITASPVLPAPTALPSAVPQTSPVIEAPVAAVPELPVPQIPTPALPANN